MPDSDPDPARDLDRTADHLYGLAPDGFVPARDDAVAQARERGERDRARAIGRLRRPTRAAWLANLLARERGEQLDGLIALAADLAAAQRTLDGDALRALSSQRHRLVAAMAREAAQLARRIGEPTTEAVLRELHGILEAALADPAVAVEVRSGRLTRTVTYSGFGPAADPAHRDRPLGDRATQRPRPGPEPDADVQQERERRDEERRGRERIDQERQERERRERELAAAEEAEATARERQHTDAAARDAAEAAHDTARDRVVALTTELEATQQQERSAAARRRTAVATAKDSARAASAAATRTARARARLAEPPPPL